MISRFVPALVLTLALGIHSAAAKPTKTVVVLNFAGDGALARREIVKGLQQGHRVLPGADLVSACERLGLVVKPGSNLSRCAKSLSASAVVAGERTGAKLKLVVYSASNGRPVASGSVRWSDRRLKRSVKRALRLITRGVGKTKAAAGKGKDDTDFSFEPDTVTQSAKDTSENPLKVKLTPKAGKRKAIVVPKQDEWHKPRLVGTLGLGTWIRSTKGPDGGNYDSGGTFAMRLELDARPLRFFLDNWAADIYMRFAYQFTIGQKTENLRDPSQEFSTTQGEFLFDLGYRWNILDKRFGPRLVAGLGVGTLDFSIDWGNSGLNDVPDVAYRFVFLSLGLDYPFMEYLAAHLRFDGRFGFGLGPIETSPQGFGDGSVNGIDFTVGLSFTMMKIIARLDYRLTNYFLNFDSFPGAVQDPSDQAHSILVTGGYAF